MFTRDRPGLSDMAVPAAMCAYEEQFGGTVPTGTYLDMCANLPVVDPTDVRCPVMILRGDHDGIAADDDLMAFFARLPSKDKQFVMVSGISHSTHLGFNRVRIHHLMDAFFRIPARVDSFAGEEAELLLKGAAE
jgi:alpha-beta hydrolase superfamily lysophospholipase